MSKEEIKSIKIKEKHRLFVDKYLENGFNATQAYKEFVATKRSKPSTHGPAASNLLKTRNVQQYLQQRLDERKNEIHVDQNYFVRKCLEIVESDYVGSTQYLTKDELERMPLAARKLVTSIDLDRSTHTWNQKYGNHEEHEEITEKYKVTFMSKDKALESIGKHTGAFMKDNVTLNANLETKSFTDALKDLDI